MLADSLQQVSSHARRVNVDTQLRRRLAQQQVEDKVPEDKQVGQGCEVAFCSGCFEPLHRCPWGQLLHLQDPCWTASPGLKSLTSTFTKSLCWVTTVITKVFSPVYRWQSAMKKRNEGVYSVFLLNFCDECWPVCACRYLTLPC